MTPAAWREIQAAQAAVVAERDRVTGPLLVLLAGDDRIASRSASEALARTLRAETVVYDGMFHEILNERDRGRVLADLGAWLDRVVPPAPPAAAAAGKA
jgi:alpha-beta hydrolase superfamily lysophospholipase